MLIVFRSKAGADVLMHAAHADEVLRALGREAAPQGVFRGPQLAQALAAWARVDATPTPAAEDGDPEVDAPALRQRAWPVCELLRRAQARGHDVIWQPA